MNFQPRSGIQAFACLLMAGAIGLIGAGCTSGSHSTEGKAPSKTAASQPVDTVPYKLAVHYFIKNNIKDSDSIPHKISDKATFDKYFGMAATMGKNGHPTPIDFKSQYLIIVDHPATNKETRLAPVSLTKRGEQLLLIYTINEGGEMSYTAHPFLLLVIDNQYKGIVILKKRK